MASVGIAAAVFAALVAATSARKIAWKSRGPGMRPPVRSGALSKPGGLPVGPGSEVLISAMRRSSAGDAHAASGDDRIALAAARDGTDASPVFLRLPQASFRAHVEGDQASAWARLASPKSNATTPARHRRAILSQRTSLAHAEDDAETRRPSPRPHDASRPRDAGHGLTQRVHRRTAGVANDDRHPHLRNPDRASVSGASRPRDLLSRQHDRAGELSDGLPDAGHPAGPRAAESVHDRHGHRRNRRRRL